MTDDDAATDQPAPADPFDLLGHEARAAILRALAAADVTGYDAEPLSYTRLFEQSGLEDSRAFDYHLEQLARHYVASTERGYAVRYPGQKLLRAVAAGTAPERDTTDFEEAAIDGVCPICESRSLTAAHDDHHLSVYCGACETPLTANTMPPAGFANRSVTEVLDAYDRLVRHRVGMAVDGVCVECAGPVTGSVTGAVPRGWDYEALAVFECSHCGFWVLASFGQVLLADADARAFLREHRDAGVVERRFWELPPCVTDAYTTVEARDPWRVRVRVPGDGERLVARFEGATLGSLTVEPSDE